ncbi:MAG: hypothetical protein OD918_01945 [Gammaproteobacteria bacterium]
MPGFNPRQKPLTATLLGWTAFCDWAFRPVLRAMKISGGEWMDGMRECRTIARACQSLRARKSARDSGAAAFSRPRQNRASCAQKPM